MSQQTLMHPTPRRLGLDLSRKQEGGIAALLSDHADRVMAATVPDPPQQTVVEWLFRALTDINAEGQGIRRPQRFDRLVAVTGCDRELLRRIINAFRTDGVSFLTPYPPEPIEDATVIDISHEALIRCWRRIADPKDGWLQREFQDGLIWRSLLALVDSFEKNPKDVLSPALTEDRRVWLQGRPPAWCERYGGGWQRATELIRASEAAASKARQRETFWQSFLVVIPKLYELFNEFMVFEVAFVSPYRRKLDMVPDFGRDYSLHIKSVFYDEWKWLITYYENRIASHAADLRSTHWNDIHQVLHKMVELGGDTHELLVNTEKLWVQLTTEILRCDQIINGFNRLAADDEMSEHYDGNWRDIYLKIYASFYMFESCMIKVRMLLFNLLRTLNNVQQLWIV